MEGRWRTPHIAAEKKNKVNDEITASEVRVIDAEGAQLGVISLEEAVQAFTDDLANALSKYGPIENWEVSRITNMSGLFSGKQGFNRDVSSWNTSGVTDMSHMFAVRSDAAPLTSL